MSSCKKTTKGAKVTRNPFINYFIKLYMENRDKSVVEVAKMAGSCWKQMSHEDKKPYLDMAARAPASFRRRRRRARGDSKRRSSRHGSGHCGTKRHRSKSASSRNGKKGKSSMCCCPCESRSGSQSSTRKRSECGK
ncbi:hypothetical protein PPYR_00840 [Photinus pyralis]|uniref:HMG box domain-containing protein n=1 Tax=Photinus pyralis TaxID=7054 RepID=A0A5N4AF41_PHOPY|nr:hypothetical protein PPYR_10004 [Photinus pyralis]KAB0803870.1 hypothetical protein PPYR_00840 [Photinus pyralis]